MINQRALHYINGLGSVHVLPDANRPQLDAEKTSYDEVALIGGKSTTWVGRSRASTPTPSGGAEPVFVSFYTRGEPYEALARKLVETLDRFGLTHDVEAVDGMGSWEKNCSMKAEFVLRKWREHGRPLVWLDADAMVEADPILLRSCGADFAAHRWQGTELGSGTLFFGAEPVSESLLERWVLRCKADPNIWDQMHLDAAWADISAEHALITEWLPRSYLSIVPVDETEAPENSVISHWQASRIERVAGRLKPKPPISEAQTQARRYARFVRTAEGLFWGVEGVKHIKPEIGVEHPEGFDVPAFLSEQCDGLTVEIGCGVGRLSGGFAPDRYVGCDINPHALPVARAANPEHSFRLITEEDDYPSGDTTLFYTVLLHVSDDRLGATLAKAAEASKRLVICEVMDRQWRRDGDPPVFNRDPGDYIAAAANVGLRHVKTERRRYERYAVMSFPDGRDTDLVALTFER